MREDYSDKFKFDIADEKTETGSRLALWIWPVLGVFAIAVIVVIALQSPWVLEKAGFPVKSPVATAAKPAAPAVARPAKQQKTAAAEKSRNPLMGEIAGLKIEMSKMADTLKAINAAMQKQNARIVKLEKIVGTVTGSISVPDSGSASSSQPKTGAIKPENQINSAAKADLLTGISPARERIKSPIAPAPPAIAHQDTGEARAKQPATKMAALNTTNIARPALKPAKKPAGTTGAAAPAKPKEQYAVKLARARSISRLAVEWERLIRGKASELSVLEPQVMPATTKGGEKVFDLVAGPFNHMADAIELCARLKLEGIKCKQSRYGGKPL